MSKNITRKEFLMASTIGAAGVLLTATTAIADEALDIKDYIPDVAISGDARINKSNQVAVDKWIETVKQSLKLGYKVENNLAGEPQSSDYLAMFSSMVVTKWNIKCDVIFDALYTVLPNGTIGDVYRIDCRAEYVGPKVEYLEGHYIRMGDNKEFGAIYTFAVTWSPGIYPDHTETFATYVEYYADAEPWRC